MASGRYTVVIVGASLAGASAALRLSRHVESVALIDSAHFPRVKSCGEGLSGAGLRYLEEIGVDLSKTERQPLRRFVIWSGDRSSQLELSRKGEDSIVGVSRFALDNAVVEAANGKSNISTFYGSAVRNVNCADSQAVVTLQDGRELRSRFVLVAAGGRSPLLHRISADGRPVLVEHGKQRRYGVSFHAESRNGDVPDDEVHIILNRGAEIYVTSVGQRTVNVALLAERAYIREKGIKEIERLAMDELNWRWSSCLVRKGGVLATGPFGSIRRQSTSPRILLLGDSAEQFDPIGGMGMTHALHSAKVVDEVIQEALSGRIAVSEAAAQYESRRYAAATLYRGFTRISYLSLVPCGRLPGMVKLRSSNLAQRIARVVHGDAERDHGDFLGRAVVTTVGRMW